MSNKALLISIKPQYVSLIKCGAKSFELRRKCPKVSEGDLALIYESSPTMSLVGAFTVGRVIQNAPSTLWRKIGSKCGISRSEFMNYFIGCNVASALEIEQFWELENQVSLSQMRKKMNIEPPQSYRYLCGNLTAELLA
jgi:predicted transcriptional regulator